MYQISFAKDIFEKSLNDFFKKTQKNKIFYEFFIRKKTDKKQAQKEFLEEKYRLF